MGLPPFKKRRREGAVRDGAGWPSAPAPGGALLPLLATGLVLLLQTGGAEGTPCGLSLLDGTTEVRFTVADSKDANTEGVEQCLSNVMPLPDGTDVGLWSPASPIIMSVRYPKADPTFFCSLFVAWGQGRLSEMCGAPCTPSTVPLCGNNMTDMWGLLADGKPAQLIFEPPKQAPPSMSGQPRSTGTMIIVIASCFAILTFVIIFVLRRIKKKKAENEEMRAQETAAPDEEEAADDGV